MSRLGVLLCLVLLPGLAMAVESRPFLAADTALNCQSLSGLMDRFFARHVKYRASRPELDERFIDLYAKRIDGSRLKYTHGEYTGLKDRIRLALLNVRWQNCEPLEALWRERTAAQVDFEGAVRQLVDRSDLEIDRDLTVQLRAKKRPRSFDRDGLREDLRGIMHFRLANYVAAKVSLEDAKKKLLRRYRNDSKRLRDEKRTDTYSGWLKTYARALDPNSSYYSPDDLAEFKISMGLALEGIGVTLRSRDGFITILKVAPGGPTEKQGILRAKDKITSVAEGENGKPVNIIDMSMREVVKLIRGKKGTKVKLTILRESPKTQTFEVVIVRDTINLEEQAAKLRWETVKRNGRKLNLAVIDLPSFYGGRRVKRSCIEDVKTLLKEAEGKADGVLFDLSRNGGGSLRSSVGISGLFMAHGGIVTIDGPAAKKQSLVDRDGAIHYKGPLVMLTSRASASGSEILVGALKDYKRAVVVGDDRTFGKGTVQNIIDLPQGLGALKVTTSYFYLPGGRTTQKEGVSSHIVVPTMLNGGEHGEARKDYVLSGDQIEPFISGVENVTDPAKRWTPITDGQIAQLDARSKKRIEADTEFKKLDEERARRRANEGQVKIDEILSEESDDDDDDDESEDKELTIQAKEALQILADLIELSN